MTLIVTHINRFGIIHASDSNLTSDDDKQVGTGQKTFPIPYLNAGLTLAGCYSVGGEPMDVWMNNFISKLETNSNLSLEQFSRALGDELQIKMEDYEKECGSMIHIAGYSEANRKSHPEFWFVRNVHGINPKTWNYENIDGNFEISEDFWTRDCPKKNLMAVFKNPDIYSKQTYVNGFTEGRVSYLAVSNRLDDFFSSLWSMPHWQFRPPHSLEESEVLVKTYMKIINDLFILSDYSAPIIGGDIQTHLIPQPLNIVESC